MLKQGFFQNSNFHGFLSIQLSLLFFRNSVKSLLYDSIQKRKVLFHYMIPAFLYCFYNNLAFTNLANFDPTSYFMFMQTRLLMTGFIYQFLFKRQEFIHSNCLSIFIPTFLRKTQGRIYPRKKSDPGSCMPKT